MSKIYILYVIQGSGRLKVLIEKEIFSFMHYMKKLRYERLKPDYLKVPFLMVRGREDDMQWETPDS